MIPAQVFCRVVSVSMESGRRGTGFLFDHRDGMALVTAAHVCSGEPEELVEFHQAWGHGRPVTGYLDRMRSPVNMRTADIAAFHLPEDLRPSWFVGKVRLGSAGLVYGQGCFVVGYPFGLSSPVGGAGQQIPIIKRAIIAGSYNTDGVQGWYVDTVANPGFSGGPLVFEVAGKPGQYAIAGVVVGSLSAPVEEPTEDNPQPQHYPSGLSQCVDVKHVLDLGLENDIRE